MGFNLGKTLLGGLGANLLGGDDEDEAGIARPTYYEDADYRKSQDALSGLGLGLLKGEVPDYYKSIGETGGKEFEDMLGLTTRDIQKSAAESSAASGRSRGGSLPAITAGAVSDAALKARYSDYNRSLAGKQDLLNTGVSVTTGVRGSGQQEGALRNNFNWKDYQAQVDERAYQDMNEAQEDAELGQMIGTIASIGLGVATGGASFGMQGAMAGGMSALTGGSDMSWLINKNPKQQMSGMGSLGSISDDLFTGKSYSNGFMSLGG